MPILTIPKELTKRGELVVIPRRDYEEFLRFRLRSVKEVKLTKIQKKALERARKNLARGKFLTIHELKRKVGNDVLRGKTARSVIMTEKILHPGMYFTKSIEVWNKNPDTVTDKELVAAAEEILMAAGPTIGLKYNLPAPTVSLLVNKKLKVVGIVRLPDRILSREKLGEKSQEQLGIILSLDRYIPIWVPLATLGSQPYVIFEYNK